jgi:hypothetical protein
MGTGIPAARDRYSGRTYFSADAAGAMGQAPVGCFRQLAADCPAKTMPVKKSFENNALIFFCQFIIVFDNIFIVYHLFMILNIVYDK